MAKEITVKCYMIMPDGVQVKPFDELTDEELADCKERMSKRLTRVMSDYYSQHMDRYACI